MFQLFTFQRIRNHANSTGVLYTQCEALYTLDVCDRCNLSIECYVFWYGECFTTQFDYFCEILPYNPNYLEIVQILNRMLDIYIGKNLRLDDNSYYEKYPYNYPKIRNNYGYCDFMRSAVISENFTIAKRVFHAYFQRNIKLDHVTISYIQSCNKTNVPFYKYYMSLECVIFE